MINISFFIFVLQTTFLRWAMFSFHHHFTNYFCNCFFYPFNGFTGPQKSILHRSFWAIPSSSVYSFTCDFTTNGTVWQRQKLIKEFAQVFRYMSYDSFAMENSFAVYFVLYLNIVVTKFWILNAHVSMTTTNVRVQIYVSTFTKITEIG